MKRKTNGAGVWIGAGAALGAGLMAILDPERGKRRRALIRDKATRAAHAAGEAAGVTWRDLSHRAAGVASEARRIARREAVSNEVLAQRVRARIGRLVSHPGSIEVTANAGEVTLGGPVLQRELDGLLRGVRCTRGVTRMEDRLEVHERPDGVPGLQGGVAARDPRFDLFQRNWSPTARLFAGFAGAGLAGLGLRRRGPLAAGLALLGSGLLFRAATNRPRKPIVRDDAETEAPARNVSHEENVAHEEIVREEPAAEIPAPPPRKRPAAPRRGPREPAPGGSGPTKGIVLKEE